MNGRPLVHKVVLAQAIQARGFFPDTSSTQESSSISVRHHIQTKRCTAKQPQGQPSIQERVKERTRTLIQMKIGIQMCFFKKTNCTGL